MTYMDLINDTELLDHITDFHFAFMYSVEGYKMGIYDDEFSGHFGSIASLVDFIENYIGYDIHDIAKDIEVTHFFISDDNILKILDISKIDDYDDVHVGLRFERM